MLSATGRLEMMPEKAWREVQSNEQFRHSDASLPTLSAFLFHM